MSRRIVLRASNDQTVPYDTVAEKPEWQRRILFLEMETTCKDALQDFNVTRFGEALATAARVRPVHI